MSGKQLVITLFVALISAIFTNPVLAEDYSQSKHHTHRDSLALSARSCLTRTAQRGSRINIRSKPVTDGTIVGTLPAGVTIVLEHSEPGSDGKGWYYMRYRNLGGWIRSDFTQCK
jgi:uncharacterized protein YraI